MDGASHRISYSSRYMGGYSKRVVGCAWKHLSNLYYSLASTAALNDLDNTMATVLLGQDHSGASFRSTKKKLNPGAPDPESVIIV